MNGFPHRGLTAVAVLTLLIPGLAACNGPDPGNGALALVVGGRNNMPRPQLLSKAREKLRQAFDRRDKLIIVGVAGEPKVRYTAPIESECDIKTACDAAFDTFAAGVQQLVGRALAETAEADTLGAILTAGRALRDYRGAKEMVVIDNGLQTKGAMPLQYPGALSVDPKALTGPWMKEGRLKDLAEVQVLFTGLGDTHPPQEPLPGELRRVLESLWRDVLTTGGATFDMEVGNLADVAPPDGLPEVTPVSFKAEPAHKPGCFRLREDQVGFIGGKAVFRDDAKAGKVLGPVADALKDSGVSAVVIGTTALPDGPDHDLSTRRARAVMRVLIGLGVAGKRLTSVGVGTDFVGFVPDTDARGRLIETIAVQNRLVIIQPAGQQC